MRTPGRPGSDRGAIRSTVESLVTAAAAVLLLGSIIGLVAVVGSAVARPGVGEILLFKPGAAAGENVVVSAQRVSGRPGGETASCDLNSALMAEGGGSIVLESRSPAGVYRVHWAGLRTSDGPQDCGRSAELTLSLRDLRQLVGAVGGRGLVSLGNVF